MNRSRGRTSASACHCARREARAKAAFSGVPSAVRSGACGSRPDKSTCAMIAPARGPGADRPRATCPRPQLAASQALKRSFSSVSRSAQNSKDDSSAFLRLASEVGRFGAISVLPSWYMPTSGPEDLRGGP